MFATINPSVEATRPLHSSIMRVIGAVSTLCNICENTAVFFKLMPMLDIMSCSKQRERRNRLHVRYVGRMRGAGLPQRRLGFFDLADIASQMKRRKNASVVISPLAAEAVKRIDAIFEIERDINGKTANERLAYRQEHGAPLVQSLEQWLREAPATLSRSAPVAKAMDYMLRDWPAFTAFLADGRICLTNNTAERALRGIALGRKSWLFAGSDRGGERAAFMYTLIVTAKMNGIDPQAWLADVLARIASIKQSELHLLLPWNWAAAHIADQNLARAA